MRTRTNQDKVEIFDPIRKKWVLLTEEEKVRQFCIQKLIGTHHFPETLIAVERQLTVNNLTKRYDIVVFNKEGNPYIVIECKAPHVTIDQSVIEQAGRYNKTLKAEIIGVTNGIQSLFFKIDFNTEEISALNFDF
jgi:hypothetical protein